ncbi:hypothetical protein SDC9_92219 [bioreactor metagenome]|uniref:Uncharacterized protein n=1 Tax=bioreactor metagenome TaxID=1076179 RepID=A0A644ZXI7_9ZZZZ
MLPGEDGGRHKESHLLPGVNGLESGPDGDLRFAKAHISAQQPVHRGRFFHVLLDFPHASELILCLDIGEGRLK